MGVGVGVSDALTYMLALSSSVLFSSVLLDETSSLTVPVPGEHPSAVKLECTS